MFSRIDKVLFLIDFQNFGYLFITFNQPSAVNSLADINSVKPFVALLIYRLVGNYIFCSLLAVEFTLAKAIQKLVTSEVYIFVAFKFIEVIKTIKRMNMRLFI